MCVAARGRTRRREWEREREWRRERRGGGGGRTRRRAIRAPETETERERERDEDEEDAKERSEAKSRRRGRGETAATRRTRRFRGRVEIPRDSAVEIPVGGPFITGSSRSRETLLEESPRVDPLSHWVAVLGRTSYWVAVLGRIPSLVFARPSLCHWVVVVADPLAHPGSSCGLVLFLAR